MKTLLTSLFTQIKVFVFTSMLLLLPYLAMAQLTAEDIAKREAAQQLITYVAIGVIIVIGLIVTVWLLVVKKDKDGKIKVKTYSPKDTYHKGGGGDGFIGGFRDGWDN